MCKTAIYARGLLFIQLTEKTDAVWCVTRRLSRIFCLFCLQEFCCHFLCTYLSCHKRGILTVWVSFSYINRHFFLFLVFLFIRRCNQVSLNKSSSFGVIFPILKAQHKWKKKGLTSHSHTENIYS